MENHETKFSLEFENHISIIHVSGKLFTAQIDEFNTFLRQGLEKSYKIIVDLELLDYICSAGVGALVACYKKTQIEGGNLIVSGANMHVKKIFEVIGFSKIFNMSHSWADNVEEAKETLDI